MGTLVFESESMTWDAEIGSKLGALNSTSTLGLGTLGLDLDSMDWVSGTMSLLRLDPQTRL